MYVENEHLYQALAWRHRLFRTFQGNSFKFPQNVRNKQNTIFKLTRVSWLVEG